MKYFFFETFKCVNCQPGADIFLCIWMNFLASFFVSSADVLHPFLINYFSLNPPVTSSWQRYLLQTTSNDPWKVMLLHLYYWEGCCHEEYLQIHPELWSRRIFMKIFEGHNKYVKQNPCMDWKIYSHFSLFLTFNQMLIIKEMYNKNNQKFSS